MLLLCSGVLTPCGLVQVY